MASSAHHHSAQHPRYSHLTTQNSRDEDAVRLPSIKDLGFRYPSRRGPEDAPPPHSLPTSIAPADTSLNRDTQDRWSRPIIQPQNQSPASIPTHLQQHQQHHQHQQQLTPPLSAGHEPPQHKNDYASKPDSGFMTPSVPFSAQSTPMPGSVTIGPGARSDNAHQSKRRRDSGTMGTPREQRSSHTAYPPHYAPYPPSQPAQPSYQMQAPMAHPPPPVQQPIDHATAQQVAPPPHPGYPTYQPQYPPPARMQLHSTPQQQPQPPPTNPYPPPPAPPSHSPWEQQPHHAQPLHQHQPPPPQIQPPPPQHAASIQQPTHPMPQHSQPPLSSQHHHIHPQHPQQAIVPPLPHHAQSQPQPHQPPPQMQQPQIPYARTTAIVPIDTRSHYPVTDDRMPPPSVRDSAMTEIMKHCQILFDFASRYAQMQQSMPEVCPGPEELQEMSHRAAEVVRLLEELRRLGLPESERVKIDNAIAMTPPEDHRPPKRPWEDMSQEEGAALVDSTSFVEQYPTPVETKMQTTAEQDMEIIRTKRATSTAGASGTSGQPKSKYRKRSRATPPGKCHSCNIRETPEWRRGPDGARTLCNACGLHYAKLQRKREKQGGTNAELPPIDMETLRASARAAEISESKSRSKVRSQQGLEQVSPIESGKPLPQGHHQGSFQLVPMVVDSASTAPVEPNRAPPPPPPQSAMAGGPTSPWATSIPPPSAARYAAPDQLQHQSFMRTSHQPTNHTPAR